MTDPRDIETVLRELRKDLTFAQAKLTAALELVAKLPQPARGHMLECPVCGLERHPDALADHLENVHGLENVALASSH
jgi:DNA repair exonuclease SbcCD ATPase subunit